MLANFYNITQNETWSQNLGIVFFFLLVPYIFLFTTEVSEEVHVWIWLAAFICRTTIARLGISTSAWSRIGMLLPLTLQNCCSIWTGGTDSRLKHFGNGKVTESVLCAQTTEGSTALVFSHQGCISKPFPCLGLMFVEKYLSWFFKFRDAILNRFVYMTLHNIIISSTWH